MDEYDVGWMQRITQPSSSSSKTPNDLGKLLVSILESTKEVVALFDNSVTKCSSQEQKDY